MLRPSLLPGVLRAVAFNTAHGEPNVALFETGTVFDRPASGETLPSERFCLAFSRSHEILRTPYEPNRAVTVHDAVAVLEALAEELRLADWKLVAAPASGFHPARAADVVVDGEVVGVVGEVAPEVIDALALVPPVVACEIDLNRVAAARSSSPTTFRPNRSAARWCRRAATCSKRFACSTCSVPRRSARGA